MYNTVCFIRLVNPGERLAWIDKTERSIEKIRSYLISKYLLMIGWAYVEYNLMDLDELLYSFPQALLG